MYLLMLWNPRYSQVLGIVLVSRDLDRLRAASYVHFTGKRLPVCKLTGKREN